MYQALAERSRLQRNAPHLVTTLPFLIPLFTRNGVLDPKVARGLGSALWMYDATGGVRIGKVHRRLSTAEARVQMPTLPAERMAAPTSTTTPRPTTPGSPWRWPGPRPPSSEPSSLNRMRVTGLD